LVAKRGKKEKKERQSACDPFNSSKIENWRGEGREKASSLAQKKRKKERGIDYQCNFPIIFYLPYREALDDEKRKGWTIESIGQRRKEKKEREKRSRGTTSKLLYLLFVRQSR